MALLDLFKCGHPAFTWNTIWYRQSYSKQEGMPCRRCRYCEYVKLRKQRDPEAESMTFEGYTFYRINKLSV